MEDANQDPPLFGGFFVSILLNLAIATANGCMLVWLAVRSAGG